MTLTNEVTVVDIKSALFNVIEELPEERVAEVLDFALSIKLQRSYKPTKNPYRTQEQIETIRKLRGSARGEHLLERLLIARAEDRERER
ncbi:MAG TPA: hypothetical protein PKZ84_20960 [Anaerolineae bacterium]|nr:hypothetical protein [Anaerolineae bacterium]HQI85223.1 hypothetical protein [Anaerolineae bacterium]